MKNKTELIVEDGKQELFIIREFNAPRNLVFKAFTDKDIIVQWLGPREMSVNFVKFEPWAGGSYRYVQSFANGMQFGFFGVCHEHLAHERIIQTYEFEGLPEKGHVILETTRFEELDNNRTKVTTQQVFQSVADRNGMVAANIEMGVRVSNERLDELIEQGKLR
jgi:uncharacterized protein YndB with AHSA1/START domain